jgi:hypothetical protein
MTRGRGPGPGFGVRNVNRMDKIDKSNEILEDSPFPAQDRFETMQQKIIVVQDLSVHPVDPV